MRVCEICGKGSMIQKSGAHRYGGGWAMRAQKTRRVWLPNLHHIRIKVNGQFRRMWLCTKCLRREKSKVKEQKQTSTTPIPA